MLLKNIFLFRKFCTIRENELLWGLPLSPENCWLLIATVLAHVSGSTKRVQTLFSTLSYFGNKCSLLVFHSVDTVFWMLGPGIINFQSMAEVAMVQNVQFFK